jgi:hypothetical protein
MRYPDGTEADEPFAVLGASSFLVGRCCSSVFAVHRAPVVAVLGRLPSVVVRHSLSAILRPPFVNPSLDRVKQAVAASAARRAAVGVLGSS